ncbi:hypothetical protein [Bartonella sp. CB178]|uniref:hypothetical protein n=1 Tax=Bartonella sp. CB178 TaxID=3112255 RepID=UPI00300E19C7
MHNKSLLQSKQKIRLAIPETCYLASFFFSIPNTVLYFYRINPTYQCNINPRGKLILYAPSFLALWAVQYAAKNPHLFSALLCHERQWYSPLALMWLKLRLKNDRRLMGSDVPDPMIMKVLHRHMAASDHSALSIGTWLQFAKNYKTNCKNLLPSLFWLDNYKNGANISQLISELQTEI